MISCFTAALELRLTDGKFHFYDPRSQTTLLSHAEAQQALQQLQAPDSAISRLAGMGLSAEQLAIALSLSIEQVRQHL